MRREIIARRKRQQRIHGILSIASLVLCIIVVFGVSGMSTNARSVNEIQEYKYYTSYELQFGDTLWSIATDNADLQHYTSVNDYIEEICIINSISMDSTLIAGTNLIIPYYCNEFKR